ncbi:MAG TPA: TIM barrel protein [Devosia sp.]|nr:TIM barrel protein [Devosia sp.]
MTRYSACIEWLFADAQSLPPLPGTPEANIVPQVAVSFPDRIRAAKAAGLDAVEFWHWSNKDLAAVKQALSETGLPLAGILCEPISRITDPRTHPAFLEGVRASLEAARLLGTRLMIAQAGDDRPGIPREGQHAALVRVLKDAAGVLAGSGVVLALEPLNDRVDHPGYFLTSTLEGLDIVDEVDRPEIRLLYDIYHSAMMGEHTEDVLNGRVDRVAHVHLADTQGRGEPGSGAMDWRARVDWLEEHGYAGYVGLEYRPTRGTLESLAFRA